jgi:pimeloyl-ACP methyl ester carboxylesterase
MIAGRRLGRTTIALVALLALCVPAGPLAAMPAGSVAAVLAEPVAVATQTDGQAPNCRSVQVPVALTEGGPQSVRLSGEVCYPTTPVDSLRDAVQVLVSGTAYGQSYWDFPYQPDTYSYVRAATHAGFTVFNFDRMGIGQSSHPISTEISIPSNAFTIHEAISQLRAGTVDGIAYHRVVIVGHSLGSLISWYEAGSYHDVDAVVASGILHSFDPIGVAKFLTTLYPAALDPKFLGAIIDPGYLTTLPGTRAASFYYAPNTDPEVVRTDEALKQTATVLEALGVFEQELPGVLRPLSVPLCDATPTLCNGVASSLIYGITRQITVPVLSVIGQYDGLLCGGATGSNACSEVNTVRQNESVYYTGIAQRCLTVEELPASGHDVNLERNAQDWFQLANAWSQFTLEQASGGGNASCWSTADQGGVLIR